MRANMKKIKPIFTSSTKREATDTTVKKIVGGAVALSLTKQLLK